MQEVAQRSPDNIGRPVGTIRLILQQQMPAGELETWVFIGPEILESAHMGKAWLLQQAAERMVGQIRAHPDGRPDDRFVLWGMRLQGYDPMGEPVWSPSIIPRWPLDRPCFDWDEVMAAAREQVLLLYHDMTGETFVS